MKELTRIELVELVARELIERCYQYTPGYGDYPEVELEVRTCPVWSGLPYGQEHLIEYALLTLDYRLNNLQGFYPRDLQDKCNESARRLRGILADLKGDLGKA